MASIEKLADNRWRARWRDPAGKQKAKTFAKRKLAKDYLDQIGVDMTAGEYIDPSAGKIKFEVLAEKWLAAQGHLKASTRSNYRHMLDRHVLARWGATPLASIAHEDVAAWVGDLQGTGLSASTIRYAHRILSLVLDMAVSAKRIRRNPASGVPLPRARKAEKRFLTHEQVQRLANAAGDYRTLVLTLAYCGLRWGELAGLKVGRVDFLKRRIHVVEVASEVRGTIVWGTPKTHATRTVPVPEFLAGELSQVVAGKSGDDLVFTTTRGHVLRNLNFRRDVFDAAAIQAGVDGVTPHELRHTAASLAVGAGANVKAVQRMLGHESAAMTLDVYSGLFDGDLDEVASKLDSEARVYFSCTGGRVIDMTERGA